MVKNLKSTLRPLLNDYGMIVVLLLLCLLFSWLTWGKQNPEGADAGRILAQKILKDFDDSPTVLIVARNTAKDLAFTAELTSRLKPAGATILATVQGDPADARKALEQLNTAATPLTVIATTNATAIWTVFNDLPAKYPALGNPAVLTAPTSSGAAFLKRDNLLNIANQIAVIAILAIGMTLVILTAGIDLSVGSLVALSAVAVSWAVQNLAGGQSASIPAVALCGLAAIALCATAGAFSGLMITKFDVPPFIATLAMMLIASGFAFLIAQGQSIDQVPPSFTWLGREASLAGIPNAVLLMLALYLLAHFVMTRTLLGRYIYAVGQNPEAARLSGVPVKRVLRRTYIICGALAGLGGVVLASQLDSGSPTYGLMYELYVIAAVVVGGTSLAGGRGKIFGTLIGAFIIAVIQNGMNLTGVESYTQKIVLGAVILAAIILDRIRIEKWSGSTNP
ncbi:MAG: ABC transporter permease [Verrucomicrobiota bacterium]